MVKKPQASMMAMAMRQFFIKSLKKFLATGQMKSKYFYKFEVSMTGKDSLIIDDLTYFFHRFLMLSRPSAT